MKRLVQQRYSLNASEIQESVEYPCGENEVRVRVFCAGVSFTDAIVALGMYEYQRTHAPLPTVLGFEFSGIITETNSKRFAVGDRVCGVTQFGAFQEDVVVQQSCVIKIPNNLSFEMAAALPVNVLTALHATDALPAHAQSALVLGASGGVGIQLIRLLKMRSVHVTALVGAEMKKSYAKQHGADAVCTRDAFKVEGLGQMYDALFLNDGTETATYMTHLRHRGVCIVYGFHSVVKTGLKKILGILRYFLKTHVSVGRLVYHNHTIVGFNIIHFINDTELIEKRMQQLSNMIENGEYGAVTINVCEISQVHTALEALLTGASLGKWVVRIRQETSVS